MAKYQQYEEYKDSGVEWLGEIPKDWKLKRIQESTSIINGYPFESSKFNPTKGMPLVRIRDIRHQKTEVFFDGVVPEAAIINNGDILIGMDGDFNVAKWTSGMAALNQRVACIRHENPIIQSFLYYLLPYHMKVVNDLTYYTTVKHLSSNDILKTTFALPSENELKNIVSFLNHETAQIDTLIEKQQTLIQLLKEKRQAVISHAVTKGLNPDAPMKDSGVEWLGDVPEHWKVLKLANYAIPLNGDRGANYPSGNDFVDEGVLFISATQVINGRVETSNASKITLKKYNQLGGLKIKKGDILYCLRGAGVGKSGICTFAEGTISSSLMGIRATSIDPYYLMLLLNSSVELQQRSVLVTGSVSPNLSAQNVMDYKFAIPEDSEQLEIIAHVKNSLKKIDVLLNKAEQAIHLMQERRTALISAAVTGKIDVRGWRVPE